MKIWQNESFINCLELILRDSGYATVDEDWWMHNVTSTFNRLYLPEKGEILWQQDGETIIMRPGFAYLIPAGFTVSFTCLTPTVSKLFFHFNLMKSDHCDLFHGLRKILSVPFPEEQLSQLLACYRSNRYQDGTAVQMYLYQIISGIQRENEISQEEISSYSAHVKDTLDYIHDHLSASLSVEKLAQRRFISKSLLTRLFDRELGISPGKYIDHQLMLTAQGLLEQTNLSIADIARDLGFTDQFYFSRRFKQLCGITPFGYRRSCKATR